MSQSKRRAPSIVIWVTVLGTLFFIAAYVSLVVFHTSIDPTESTFTVTLHNDTSSTVVVKQCDVTCNSFRERDSLQAGASVKVNTSSDDLADWWVVSDATGNTLGCLLLRYRHKVDELIVNVSERTGCPA